MDIFSARSSSNAAVKNTYDDQFPTSKLYTGMGTTKSKLLPAHKLETSEAQYDSAMRKVQLERIRKVQGIHAPQRFCTELKILSQQGGRLPCLQSSNIGRNIILGMDNDLTMEEVFNASSVEVCGNPQLMMEHKIGM